MKQTEAKDFLFLLLKRLSSFMLLYQIENDEDDVLHVAVPLLNERDVDFELIFYFLVM